MANKKKENKNERVMTQLNADPQISGAESEQEFFSHNFKNFLIKTDEPVELPKPLAEVVQNKNKTRRDAKKFAKKMAFKDAKPPVE